MSKHVPMHSLNRKYMSAYVHINRCAPIRYLRLSLMGPLTSPSVCHIRFTLERLHLLSRNLVRSCGLILHIESRTCWVQGPNMRKRWVIFFSKNIVMWGIKWWHCFIPLCTLPLLFMNSNSSIIFSFKHNKARYFNYRQLFHVWITILNVCSSTSFVAFHHGVDSGSNCLLCVQQVEKDSLFDIFYH